MRARSRHIIPAASLVRPLQAGDHDARHRTSLYKTLRTYFERRLAVQETADQLHIHRNTLQKRFANVEQLLGIDLGDLDAVVDVRLGLHAAELLGDPGA